MKPDGLVNPPAPVPAPAVSMLLRLALYFRPHVFGMAFAVSVSWLVRSLSVMGGACRVLCYPPVTIGMGLLGGFLGAQLYRNNHPLPTTEPEAEPATLAVSGPTRVRGTRPRVRRAR
ncbi:MAG: hypothetical protein SFW67_19140 [Myxococcaceae bacterium]|nr:hypothetical protein [Myxococcaceae bacterium]